MKKLFIICTLMFSIVLSAMDFVTALAMVDSDMDQDKISDNGQRIGIFQLKKEYVDDVNNILQLEGFFDYGDRYNNKRATTMVVIYLCYHSNQYFKQTGKRADHATLARIHKYGPDGWKDPSTLEYGQKVVNMMKIDYERPETK